jgi:DnaJ-class molecular chaperone
MAEEDYYKILGVAKSASSEELQKAYRKLARKYHPDLHADSDEKEKQRAKQEFQKVQQAYDVLSDPKKRKMYDQMGPGFDQMGGNPFGGQSPFGGAGGMDIDLASIFGGAGRGGAGGGGGFEQIFRQMGGQGPRGGRRPQQPPQPPKPMEEEITIPFAVAIKGGEHQLSFQRSNGKVESINVKIPAGIENEKKIRLRGQGARGYEGAPRGDLLIKVKVAQHPNFSRNGLNLLIKLPITLLEAAEGAKIDLPTPHGTITLTVPPATSSGKSLRLKGMGVHTKDRKGDLIAELQIVVPEDLTDEDVELIRKFQQQHSDEDPRRGINW